MSLMHSVNQSKSQTRPESRGKEGNKCHFLMRKEAFVNRQEALLAATFGDNLPQLSRGNLISSVSTAHEKMVEDSSNLQVANPRIHSF